MWWVCRQRSIRNMTLDIHLRYLVSDTKLLNIALYLSLMYIYVLACMLGIARSLHSRYL